MSSMRGVFYRHLNPRAWPEPGLSWVNKCIIVVILISVGLVILETEPFIHDRFEKTFYILNHIFIVFFTLEYVLRIWARGEDPRYRGILGRLRYMGTPWSLVDLFAILPFYLSSFGLIHLGNDAFAIRLLRLARVLVLARTGPFAEALIDVLNALVERRRELIASILLAIGLLVMAAIALYWAERSVQPEAFGSIPRALWWGVATLTTVGYGDVYPVTAVGKVAAGVSAIIGIGVIAIPTGILAASFSDVMQERRDTRQKEDEPEGRP